MPTLKNLTPKRIAHLNRRQRKKLHVSEFQEFAFEIMVKFHTPLNEEIYDIWMDTFIDFIESLNLNFGGGGKDGEFSGVIVPSSSIPLTEEDRTKVEAFLRAGSEVLSVQCSELKDAWYGWGVENG